MPHCSISAPAESARTLQFYSCHAQLSFQSSRFNPPVDSAGPKPWFPMSARTGDYFWHHRRCLPVTLVRRQAVDAPLQLALPVVIRTAHSGACSRLPSASSTCRQILTLPEGDQVGSAGLIGYTHPTHIEQIKALPHHRSPMVRTEQAACAVPAKHLQQLSLPLHRLSSRPSGWL